MNDTKLASRHAQQIELLLDTFQCIIGDKNSVYVSAPITTGERFCAWYADHSKNGRENLEYTEAHRSMVIEPNRLHARAAVRTIRREVQGVVIDPTMLPDVSGWTQSDYHSFWGQVIQRYAGSVIFLEGWQYSNGCAFEFLTASRAKITTLDESQKILTFQHGIELLKASIQEMQANDIPVTFLGCVLEALCNNTSMS